MRQRIVSMGTALPPHVYSQEELFAQLGDIFGGSPLARQVFSHPGIRKRHLVLAQDELASYRQARWGTAKRNRVYADRAPPLAAEAARQCLEGASVKAADIGTLVVTTCTGLIAPGLDVQIAARLGMKRELRRFHLGGMGCYAALPGLNCALKSAEGGLSLLVAAELCSLHLQPTDDSDSVVSASLFADGAAALLLGGDRESPYPQVLDSLSWTEYATQGEMTWRAGDYGFRMSLSSYVPQLIGARIDSFLAFLLEKHRLTVEQIPFWAIHPGGAKILDEIQGKLGLSDGQMLASRDVLRACGNMSSATVLFVLDHLSRQCRPKPGDYGVMLAFGPGLTFEGCLLRW